MATPKQVITTLDSVFYQELAAEINDVRLSRNITIEELAQECGVSRSTMDRYLLGRFKMKKDFFLDICDALSIPQNLDVKVSIGLRSSRKD